MNNKKREKFIKGLTSLINKNSYENYWDMPDFIMANFVESMIVNTSFAMKKNLVWHCERDIEYERAKVEKLKRLVLLQDPAVSSEQVDNVNLVQWNEFVKCFPDEDTVRKKMSDLPDLNLKVGEY